MLRLLSQTTSRRTLQRVLRRRAKISMRDRGRKPCLAQPPSDAFGDVDRPVSPAGTAERDRHIGFPLGAVAREEEKQQLLDACHRFVVSRVGSYISSAVRVESGPAPHSIDPLRIA